MARLQRLAPVRTTLYLPPDLSDKADRFIAAGAARSKNDLVVNALRRMLDQLEREAIDAEFAGMAGDTAYQEEARQICREFAASDWEALQLGEAAAGNLDE